MSNTSKILIGKIVAPQGLRGEVRVQTFTDTPEDLKDLDVLDIKLTFIRSAGRDVAICRVDGINDRNGAETLRGTELYVDRDSLPDLSEDEFYQADLIGMDVVQDDKKVGRVVTIHNFGAGDILEVESGDLFSFVGADVNRENKTIYVK